MSDVERPAGLDRRRRRCTAALATTVLVAGATLLVPGQPANAATIDPLAYYQIVSRHSGKAIEIAGQSTANGAAVQQWTRTGQANQQFQFVDAGGGYYKLRARHSGSLVDVSGASTANGADVVQWPDNNGANQQFRVVDTDSGYVKLVNRNSGKPLEVWDWSTADGGRISQYTDTGGANQQWQLVPTDSQPPTTYAGYLFSYMTGEGSANGEQVYFALSQGNDPVRWRQLNGGNRSSPPTSAPGVRGTRSSSAPRRATGSFRSRRTCASTEAATGMPRSAPAASPSWSGSPPTW